MSQDFEMTITAPAAEVDRATPADLLCGLTATLEIRRGNVSWRDEHFPVLEFALALKRNYKAGDALHFSSMCMEEDPVLRITPLDGKSELLTFDGFRLEVRHAELATAATELVRGVDRTLHEMFGLSISDVDRSLR